MQPVAVDLEICSRPLLYVFDTITYLVFGVALAGLVAAFVALVSGSVTSPTDSDRIQNCASAFGTSTVCPDS